MLTVATAPAMAFQLIVHGRCHTGMKNFWIFCIATVFLACESNDISLKSNPINSTIIIEAREELGPDTRRLTLFCKTGKTYPCINFPILTEWTKDESAVEVTFTAVGETVVCLTAIGPATTLVDLDGLSNGEYAIEVNNANLKNKGTLKVTDISLLFDKKNGIDFVRSNTKRVPDNTYWGTIGYHDESSSTLVDEFVQKFSDAGAVFSAQTPGHYFSGRGFYPTQGDGKAGQDRI